MAEPTLSPDKRIAIVTEERMPFFEKAYIEVGDAAVWSVSSAKHGNGVSQLRDDDPNTYWQSDGSQPHRVKIVFPHLTSVWCVALLLNYPADESYTPRRVVINASTNENDVAQIAVGEVDTPKGWLVLRVLDDSSGSGLQRVWATSLSIVILENHQNGRDTHLRGVKVFGPRVESTYSTPAFTAGLRTR